MTSKQLKKIRREMISEHAERIRKIDVEIAKLGIIERRMVIDFPHEVRRLTNKLLRNIRPATWGEIASELNRRGYKAPLGKRWSYVSIERWFKGEWQ